MIDGALQAFSVRWQTARDGGGLRRVVAVDERDAAVIAPKLIASDLNLPEHSIQVVSVRAAS